MKLPTGFRFRPSEEELIRFYLKPKNLGQALPCDIVQEKPLYSGDPWRVLDFGDQENIYVFTKLTKKSAGGRKKEAAGDGGGGGREHFVRAAGCGTWDGQTGPKKIIVKGEVIGFKKMLVFENPSNSAAAPGRYIMHEFSLPGSEWEYVLCEITLKRSKKRKNFEIDQIYGTDGGQPSAAVEEEDDNESMLMIGNQIQQPLAAVEYVNGGQYQANDDEQLMMIQELGGNQYVNDDQYQANDEQLMIEEELGGDNQIQQPLEAINYVNGGQYQAHDDQQLMMMNSTGNHDDQNQQWDGLLSMEELSYIICGGEKLLPLFLAGP